jgi:hypothetical protein
MRIELLYVRGCPHHDETLALVKRVVEEERIVAGIEEIEVADAAQAKALGFLGSPSVRIDGWDIEPGARERGDFGLSCRVYANGAGFSGIPPRELIRGALARDH